uniref:Uncharacterized protein n=1 Tax=Tanacetum cinerariifolium TaxID=118510 RepID=A0A699JJH8_TANCI|nr:hypothetical protein [Tanacetum cinerariifolium]
MMETDEINERYISPCFVNGLEAYDGDVNLEFDKNLISNKFAVKLCLDYESSNDWDQSLDFNFDDVPKFGEELPPFICKMEKSNHNKKRTMENLNLFYQDIGLSSSAGSHLTQKEAKKEALAVMINQKFTLLEEERHVELDRKTVKEEDDAVKRIKREALKEKDDPCAFIFPISILNTLDRLFSTFDGVCHQTFRAARFDVLRTADIDSDDKEEYVIKRNRFGAPIYGLKLALYLNFTNPEDRSSAI